MRSLIVQRLTCLIASFLIAGCAVPPPKGFMCMLNAKSEYKLCFNMETDFEQNGDVKKGIKGERVPVHSLGDLHTYVVIDVDSYASLKAFLLKQKERCEAK
jgi:hypothetical protein